jgi:hypothetical protein
MGLTFLFLELDVEVSFLSSLQSAKESLIIIDFAIYAKSVIIIM